MASLLVLLGAAGTLPGGGFATDATAQLASVRIDSLSQLSIEALRQRSFEAQFTLEAVLGDEGGNTAYSRFYGPPYHRTLMASYLSDGLRVYARIDFPPASLRRPDAGFPVIIYAHGWVGEAGAPRFGFFYAANSNSGDVIDRYVKAGYVVVMPGFRGHGQVNGVPAQGLEFIQAYDNGSYLAPQFYAIDLLHALQAVSSLDRIQWPTPATHSVKIDRDRIYLTGHSQGGDAAFTALAVSSSPRLQLHFRAASIWAGCIAGRIEQGGFYGPMENSAAALRDPAYFPYMPPWWKPSDHSGSIQDGIDERRRQMYQTVRTYVSDQANASLETNSLVEAMRAVDAVAHPQHIAVPLDLHFSDRDHYSTPSWNAAIVRSIRNAGGTASAYVYPGNGHDFRLIPGWSPRGSAPAREVAIARTLARFSTTSR